MRRPANSEATRISSSAVNETSSVVSDQDRSGTNVHRLEWSLFWISVLGLFLELMMIRWMSTEIRIFAYLQNTVLVVCFLGLGMGCLTSRKPFQLASSLWGTALLVLLLAIPFTRAGFGSITTLLGAMSDFTIWEQQAEDSLSSIIGQVFLGMTLTLILMTLLWSMFVPLGRALGRWMNEHPQVLRAYTMNVLGSLVGILLFAAMSVAELPPWVWCVTLGLLYVTLQGGFRNLKVIEWSLVTSIVAFAWISGIDTSAIDVRWSPYQKLTLKEVDGAREEAYNFRQIGKYLINVNNAGYQGMIDLSPANVSGHPEHFDPAMAGFSQYDIPFLVHNTPRKVLIVGAGSGNDVAGALRNGAQEVVAVEIDPVILSMGQRFHPEQPYHSNRVRIVRDDARSFMANSNEKFDVILFGLLDSHTTSAMTNSRLDHYVYTIESLKQARSLLREDGVLALSFEVQKTYIGDRIHHALTEVFGTTPIEFTVPQNSYGWGGRMFLTGDLTGIRNQLQRQPELFQLLAQWNAVSRSSLAEVRGESSREESGKTKAASNIAELATPIEHPVVEVATDDWPYLYLEARSIPTLYFLLAGMLACLFFGGLWRLNALPLLGQWRQSHWHFFFLGAAFMLLEVQNISKASVVLGSTWWVNAVIIGAIMVMVLCANWIAARFPSLPTGFAYIALLTSCLGLYFLDIAMFASLPYAMKALVVGGLTCLPMLFSGLVFARSFAAVAEKDVALGANLFGSLIGGFLQTITFVTGTKALLLIVAALYALAWRRQPQTSTPEPTATNLSENNPEELRKLSVSRGVLTGELAIGEPSLAVAQVDGDNATA